MSTQFIQEEDRAIKIYLRDIGQTPLLTPKEEKDLARKIRKGDDAARQRMINANLRLVVRIAGNYMHYGLPFLDLIAEGNIGLMKAVDRYDPAKGNKLCTYAAWWIRQGIRRALINKSRTIRITAFTLERIQKMEKATASLTQLLGREPSDVEIAAELNAEPSKVAEWKTMAMKPVSLDAPVVDDSAHAIADTVPDPENPPPYEALAAKELRTRLYDSLRHLAPRSRAVIAHRFGLEGDRALTLEEVGSEYSLTRERVRQIQRGALTQLRQLMKEHAAPTAGIQGRSAEEKALCSS